MRRNYHAGILPNGAIARFCVRITADETPVRHLMSLLGLEDADIREHNLLLPHPDNGPYIQPRHSRYELFHPYLHVGKTTVEALVHPGRTKHDETLVRFVWKPNSSPESAVDIIGEVADAWVLSSDNGLHYIPKRLEELNL